MKPSVILTSSCNTDEYHYNKQFLQKIRKVIKTKFNPSERENLKISMIVTAKLNKYDRSKSRDYLWKKSRTICRNFQKIINIPVDCQCIDCSDKENIPKFIDSIQKNKIIMVLGGDTFYLWYHLKKNNLDKLIYDRVTNHNVLYLGCCAGAILAGETIDPAYFYRKFPPSKPKYTLKKIYKKKFWKKASNRKTFKFIDRDILTWCNSNKLKKYRLDRKKRKGKKTRKILCLHKKELIIQ